MELSEADKKRVWNRGQHSATSGLHLDHWGAKIVWEQYGTDEEFGWRAEPYIRRTDRPEAIDELEPFHWKNAWERDGFGRALKKVAWNGLENAPIAQ